MRHTAQHDIGTTMNLMSEYQENPKMEALWKKTFSNEYKPDVFIDFQKIKDMLIERKIRTGRELPHYNYNLIHPIALCDIFITHPPKQWSVSFLESLPENTQRALADLLLGAVPIEDLHHTLGISFLFWIWHYCYVYSTKRNEHLKEFFIGSTSFVGSEKHYNLLEKCRLQQRQLHRKSFAIYTTLSLFDIAKHLPEDITDDNIQEYLQHKLGKDFSLSSLYARGENTHGQAEERYGKNVDARGTPISPDNMDTTFRYDKDFTGRYIKIPNRQNLDIHKDRSGMAYKIFLDGPIGIGLFHHNTPIALISFSLQNPNTLFIHQIQAVSAEHFDRYGRLTHQKTDPLLQTIPWQKTLYDIVTLLAKKYQCTHIVLQCGENNPWIDISRTELQYDEKKGKLSETMIDQPHLSLSIAQEIYDVFAEKQGFAKNKKTKNRDKKI